MGAPLPSASDAPDHESSLETPEPIDLRRTLGPLGSGFADPTLVVTSHAAARATVTPEGPASLLIEQQAGRRELHVRSWGPGAGWAHARVADLVGLSDRPPRPASLPEPFSGLAARSPGMRLPRTHRVVECLALVVLQQLVQGREAARAWRNLVLRHSTRAPGPLGRGRPALWLPPDRELLLRLPPAAYPPLGVLARQAETLRRIALHAARLEEAATMTPDAAEERLCAIRGVGLWSARSVLLRALGAPDAIVVGDYNLPAVIVSQLGGVPAHRAEDADMLALLEPVRGQRGRASRWITAVSGHPPRRAPRRAMRPLPTP